MKNTEQIALLPKQMLLKEIIENSNYSWIGYGGARGGAKSYAIRELALLFGLMPEHGMKSLIFRRFSKELLKNHILPLYEKHPKLMEHYNKTEKILYAPNGNPIIQFGYADSESDIYSFQGFEFDLIFIDEAAHCTPHQIQFLKTSNRSVKPNFVPKMVLTMNPGGVSHSYLKRLFIDKKYYENEDPSQFFFIQSFLWDNVFWSLKHLKKEGVSINDYYHKWSEEERRDYCIKKSTYAANLRSLPDELRIAYLYGDWEVFGGSFFKNFEKGKQVIAPFAIPPDWMLIGSIDPGFSSPCSFGLTARDFNGNIYRIFTYYEKERTPSEHAEAISNILKDDPILQVILNGRKPSIIASGTDAFAKKEKFSVISHENTFADVFASYGLFLSPAYTSRKIGWWSWKSLFPSEKNPARYFIFSGLNEPLLSEMMSAVYDAKEPEDISGRGNSPTISDHALDEQRYGIMALFKPADAPPKISLARSISIEEGSF
jgi:phage terminase large subunit